MWRICIVNCQFHKSHAEPFLYACRERTHCWRGRSIVFRQRSWTSTTFDMAATMGLKKVQRLVINSTLNVLQKVVPKNYSGGLGLTHNGFLVFQVPAKGPAAFVCAKEALHTSAKCLQRKNYYGVLGVSKSSTVKEIKEAYYRLAKKYHPDSTTSTGDAESRKLFLEVSEAYEVLSDEKSRKEFDTYGETSQDARRAQDNEKDSKSSAFGKKAWSYQTTVDPEEMFRRIFGDAFKDTNPFEEPTEFTRSIYGYGPSEEIALKLTFEEAAIGGFKEVLLNVISTCPKCRGSGCELGTLPVTCATCNGTGMETLSKGPFCMRSTCSECNGKKVVRFHPCTECEGLGEMVLRKRTPIPIPPGVEDGHIERIAAELQEVTVSYKVMKSEYFRKDNFDLHSDAIISISQAFLGGETMIKGLYEDIIIEISPGTSSHNMFQLKGRGIKMPDGAGYGDHYVHFIVHVPTGLSQVEKDFLIAFASLDDSISGTVNGLSERDMARWKRERKLQEIHDQLMALHEENMRNGSPTPWLNSATTENIHIEWDCTAPKKKKTRSKKPKPPAPTPQHQPEEDK